MPSPYKISIRNSLRESIPRRELQKALRLALREEGVSGPCEVSLLICDDETIHRYNREYRGLDCPTDVLSFSQKEGELPPLPENGVVLLGDILISLPTARRQAERLRRSLSEELLTLALHGLLHLLDYLDETPAAARKMRERVARYLSRLNKEGGRI